MKRKCSKCGHQPHKPSNCPMMSFHGDGCECPGEELKGEQLVDREIETDLW